jgi:hypothetical protein
MVTILLIATINTLETISRVSNNIASLATNLLHDRLVDGNVPKRLNPLANRTVFGEDGWIN